MILRLYKWLAGYAITFAIGVWSGTAITAFAAGSGVLR